MVKLTLRQFLSSALGGRPQSPTASPARPEAAPVRQARLPAAGADAPTASDPGRVQVTTPLAWLQVQPEPEAVRKVTDGGSVSVITMAPPAFGPLLLAVRV
jgi:hypothetical protein